MVKIKILFLMNFKEKMRNKPKLAMSSHITLRIKNIFKISLAKIFMNKMIKSVTKYPKLIPFQSLTKIKKHKYKKSKSLFSKFYNARAIDMNHGLRRCHWMAMIQREVKSNFGRKRRMKKRNVTLKRMRRKKLNWRKKIPFYQMSFEVKLMVYE